MYYYKISNKFVEFYIDNQTDIDISCVSSYLYNYLLITKCGNIPYDNSQVINIKYENNYNNYSTSNDYLMDGHKLIKDGNGVILLLKREEKEIVFLKRFIIDYANRIIERNGGFFLHGSSVVDSGKSIIFTGDKMSGKTTNMLYMLDRYGLSYSSNERVAIINNGKSIFSYGCPSNINIRIGTLCYNSNLFSKFSKYVNSNTFNLEMKDIDKLEEQRLVFSVNDIARIFETGINPSGTITCICNLTFLPEVDFSMRELTFKEKLIILKRNLISGIYPTRKDTLEEILPIQYNKTLLDISSLKCYNICHNNTSNNIEKIYDRIKEYINNESRKNIENNEKLQNKCKKYM